MNRIALVVPYFNNGNMLARQIAEWEKYPSHVLTNFTFVVVDDCSERDPAAGLILDHAYPAWLGTHLQLYRIDTPIEWNQHGARNLAAQQADPGDWLLMLDIDHVLTAENAARLATYKNLARGWYKFPRERIGAADETRAKDLTLRGIRPDVSGVAVNPGMNCYLVSRDAYWQAGGYNETFCGTYGGDSQFLRDLKIVAGEPVMLNDVWLQVHTRHSVPDANEQTLNRDPAPFRARLAEARRCGTVRGHEPYCRFEWRRVL